MGKLAAAMLSSLLAVVLGAAGIALTLWVATALYRVEWAREWAVWTIEHSPLPLYAPSIRVADDLIQRDALIALGVGAAVLCLMAFSSLRLARQALRSADESHDGKGTIELKTRPLRVGRPVEGNIWLAQDPAPGQLYRVELSCKRDHGSGRSEGSETPYSEELEAAPVRTPVGWSLPFRFVVPLIAPPSGASRYMSGPGYRWRLSFQRSKGWISFPSLFALNLAPAPPEELRALEKKEAAAQRQAINEIVRSVGKEPVLHERIQLREPSPADPGGTAALKVFGDVSPGDARAADTAAHNSSTGAEARASRGGAAPGGARADDPLAYNFSTDVSESASSLPGKIVKWVFLVVFGGVLAVSAVALATAVLLRHIM